MIIYQVIYALVLTAIKIKQYFRKNIYTEITKWQWTLNKYTWKLYYYVLYMDISKVEHILLKYPTRRNSKRMEGIISTKRPSDIHYWLTSK